CRNALAARVAPARSGVSEVPNGCGESSAPSVCAERDAAVVKPNLRVLLMRTVFRVVVPAVFVNTVGDRIVQRESCGSEGQYRGVTTVASDGNAPKVGQSGVSGHAG